MSDERELQTYFDALRGSDERSAPAFVLPRSGNRRRATAALWKWSLAASFVAAIGVGIISSSRTPEREKRLASNISQWSSPTKSLLQFPDNPLVSEVPHVASDVFPSERTPR